MREALPLVFALAMPPVAIVFSLAMPAVAIVFAGCRLRQPAWIVGGNLVGYALLAAGLWWAAEIGEGALWAALLAAFGVATWAQVEALWWRRRRGR